MKFRKITGEELTVIFTVLLSILGAVFGILSSDAAESVWFYNLLDYLPFAFEYIIAGLILPVACGIIFLTSRSLRSKLIAVLYTKLALEIMLMPFGVNINVHSGLFYGDLSFVFFVLLDLLLIYMADSERFGLDVEGLISGTALAAVGFVSAFGVILSEDKTAMAFRSAYLICFYLCVYLLTKNMEERRAEIVFDSLKVGIKNTIMLICGLLIAFVSLSSFIYFAAIRSGEVLPATMELIKIFCYLTWMCFFAAAATLFVVDGEYSLLNTGLISAGVAFMSTVALFGVTTCGTLVRSLSVGINIGFGGALSRNLQVIKSFDWSNLLIPYALTFIGGFFFFRFMSKYFKEICQLEYEDDLEFYEGDFEFFDEDYEEPTESRAVYKSEERLDRKQEDTGKVDTFSTLSYLANALVRNKDNDTPLLFTAKKSEDDGDTFSVVITGNEEDRELLVRVAMLSYVKGLSADMGEQKACVKLSGITCDIIERVAKSVRADTEDEQAEAEAYKETEADEETADTVNEEGNEEA